MKNNNEDRGDKSARAAIILIVIGMAVFLLVVNYLKHA